MHPPTLLPRPARFSRRQLQAQNNCLIVVNTEGSVLNSRTLRHQKVLAPAFVECFRDGNPPEVLQEIWRFVSLESRFRGNNDFRLLSRALRYLAVHPHVKTLSRRWEETAHQIDAWLASVYLGHKKHLHGYIQDALKNGRGESSTILQEVFNWKAAIDIVVDLVPNVRPFRSAYSTLSILEQHGEIIALGDGSSKRLRLKYDQHDLGETISEYSGDDQGLRRQRITQRLGRGRSEQRVLFISDTIEDLEIARAVGAQFFPIIRDRENECWDILANKSFDDLLAGRPMLPRGLLSSFLLSLPSNPAWQEGARVHASVPKIKVS